MTTLEVITVEEIKSVMNEVVEKFLIPRFNKLNMNATGDWLAAVGGEAEPNRGIIMGLDYTEKLVHGQEPTTVPIPDLKRWAKAKFKLSDAAAAVAAVRVQKKIEAVGTTWYEQGGSNLLEVLEEQDTINFVNMKLGQIATPRIKEHLIRQMIE
ncbi:uncharacterized protein CHSO_1096 [Chryseobacterium sp. StRB126]|uniref:hypothetical protein n=1 Tax=Chryseobacterium sp. StRB126 TaxID=878220 RepID=UPI0004E998A1|nr:hypothetical protein [Chryseobacterium sp. StRB126]BAP30133.1 uncharacterized protein CHSO_1096 [Chryseobacterium sp. StRB126]